MALGDALRHARAASAPAAPPGAALRCTERVCDVPLMLAPTSGYEGKRGVDGNSGRLRSSPRKAQMRGEGCSERKPQVRLLCLLFCHEKNVRQRNATASALAPRSRARTSERLACLCRRVLRPGGTARSAGHRRGALLRRRSRKWRTHCCWSSPLHALRQPCAARRRHSAPSCLELGGLAAPGTLF